MEMTIGGQLERWRLERRALRLELVVALLDERVSRCAQSGPPPPGLERALCDFTRELDALRRRLESCGAAGREHEGEVTDPRCRSAASRW